MCYIKSLARLFFPTSSNFRWIESDYILKSELNTHICYCHVKMSKFNDSICKNKNSLIHSIEADVVAAAASNESSLKKMSIELLTFSRERYWVNEKFKVN